MVVVALAAVPAPASAADIIVRRDAGLDRAQRADMRSDAGVTLVSALTLPDTEVVHADDPQAALAALNADPDVRYAELDRTVRAFSDDPLFSQQWALRNTGQFGGLAGADMDVPDAWALSTGAGVTVAVVDTGVDAGVADLAGQLAGNAGEIPGNGLDDDGNGLVDDARGWDFEGGDNDPADQQGHGTHVAGTVAAIAGNRAGVAGVAPDARVLPIRVLDAAGQGSDSAIAQGFDYAGDLGVRIVNASLGGPGSSQTVTDAMAAHPDTLYVIAAGNDGADDDASPLFPCTSPAPNVLCVGATDNRDGRASFSNYGASTVDVFAPGLWIESTLKGGGYGFMSGTSMASPNVAGTAALALAANPRATTAQLKAALVDSVDARSALRGLSVSGGRVDAAAAVEAAVNLPAPTPTPMPTAMATPVATPVATATPEQPAVTPPAVAEQPAPAPPSRAPAVASPEVRTLKLSGKLPGRLQATFTVTRGTAVQIEVARAGRAKSASASWSLAAHAGTNTLRLSRRVHGRTLARGRYTLTIAVAGSARSAAFTVK
jgi:subtilisin family serine protease